jgi:hypothetical protein
MQTRCRQFVIGYSHSNRAGLRRLSKQTLDDVRELLICSGDVVTLMNDGARFRVVLCRSNEIAA